MLSTTPSPLRSAITDLPAFSIFPHASLLKPASGLVPRLWGFYRISGFIFPLYHFDTQLRWRFDRNHISIWQGGTMWRVLAQGMQPGDLYNRPSKLSAKVDVGIGASLDRNWAMMGLLKTRYCFLDTCMSYWAHLDDYAVSTVIERSVSIGIPKFVCCIWSRNIPADVPWKLSASKGKGDWKKL